MNILLCPDKFKGSLSAREVCEALSKGIATKYSQANIVNCPLADGGDGSLQVLEEYMEVETVTVDCTDPLGRPIKAAYRQTGATAYIEVAAASGLVLLSPQERNCLKTTSFGTGQLVAHAINNGAREVYLFLGGSATNDGGIGIASALGFEFLDESGRTLAPIGENLGKIHTIDDSSVLTTLKELTVKVVCDVDNPLVGPTGAAHVYAPQKGATPAGIALLDDGLSNLAKKLVAAGYPDVVALPGAGAAGGIGGGAVAFLSGQLQSGTATFLEMSGLELAIQQADLVITGEGFLDRQTAQGKLVSGVCQLAKQYGKPIIGVCGDAEEGIADLLGLQTVYTVRERSASLEEAMTTAAKKLEIIGQELS